MLFAILIPCPRIDPGIEETFSFTCRTTSPASKASRTACICCGGCRSGTSPLLPSPESSPRAIRAHRAGDPDRLDRGPVRPSRFSDHRLRLAGSGYAGCWLGEGVALDCFVASLLVALRRRVPIRRRSSPAVTARASRSIEKDFQRIEAKTQRWPPGRPGRLDPCRRRDRADLGLRRGMDRGNRAVAHRLAHRVRDARAAGCSGRCLTFLYQ